MIRNPGFAALAVALISCTIGLSARAGALASEATYLDPPYAPVAPVRVDDTTGDAVGDATGRGFEFRDREATRAVSLFDYQSPVRSQGARGTCSIFSATAMLESMLILNKNYSTETDLSEEWLEYHAMVRNRREGSGSRTNFDIFRAWGSPSEAKLPYIGESWKTLDDSPLARERCGHLETGAARDAKTLEVCLLAHRDPRLASQKDAVLSDSGSPFYDIEYRDARAEARAVRADGLATMTGAYAVTSSKAIKELLRDGVPLTLDIAFYFGAWNHRGGEALGLVRNMDQWNQGIVGYPAANSVDRVRSKEDPAGHSVLIVGYDDNVEVTTRVPMMDGTEREFTYRGVYYFKNSWGTESFGSLFAVDGVAHPGYGMITQKYAHEFGGFYRLPLK